MFLLVQRYTLNRSVSTAQEQMEMVQSDMDALRAEQIEELFIAQEVKDAVDEQATLWSKVVRRIQDLTPVTVFFSSYSGSADGAIQLSGLGDSYGSVADVISALRDSDYFTDVFAPSVTLGTTSEGQEVVSFSLQTQSTSQ